MKSTQTFATLPGLILALCLSGCVSLGGHPNPPAVYDFGPGDQPAASAQGVPSRVPLVLGEIEAGALPEGNAMLYRLAYADGQQLRPYAQARWSVAPAELLRRTLREQLSKDQPVLTPQDGAALREQAQAQHLTLRVELQDFSQVFDTAAHSHAWLRLPAAVLEKPQRRRRSALGAAPIRGVPGRDERGCGWRRPGHGAGLAPAGAGPVRLDRAVF